MKLGVAPWDLPDDASLLLPYMRMMAADETGRRRREKRDEDKRARSLRSHRR